jgi:hypothetical protein
LHICAAHPNKDNGRSLCHETIKLEQSRVLVGILVDIDVELLDALDGQLLVSQSQDVGTWRKALGVVDDGRGKGGGEEDGLNVLWQKTRAISSGSHRSIW